MLSDNTCVIIEEIQVEQLSKPETTYNFEVEAFHTYYVSDSKILVHNDCIKKELTKIANKYGNEQCVECADEMQSFLESKGLHGERVEVRSVKPNQYMVSDTYSATTAISSNGYHVGIKYKGLVFDNIHKTGISYSAWKADFFCPSGVYFPKPIPF